jgi:hypothetical protein
MDHGNLRRCHCGFREETRSRDSMEYLCAFVTIDPYGNESVNVYKSVTSCVLDVKIVFYNDEKTAWNYNN